MISGFLDKRNRLMRGIRSPPCWIANSQAAVHPVIRVRYSKYNAWLGPLASWEETYVLLCTVQWEEEEEIQQ